jgi:hypothetical protein
MPQRKLGQGTIEFDERIAGRDAIARIDMHRGNESGGARRERGVLPGRHRAGELKLLNHALEPRLRHDHARGLLAVCALLSGYQGRWPESNKESTENKGQAAMCPPTGGHALRARLRSPDPCNSCKREAKTGAGRFQAA